ncbi:protein FAM149B1-like [Dendronephthya gigantea]|uniref:protein FAM149B1-like n=1 Tax=Dendronephthya gigantea TaxID=151771 RepID=UPI001069951D|nr:protein FAM149B1-like [Dendronephthya gigantea]
MMTNRISPLEIRGFSRGNSELLRPLPEKAEEPLQMTYVETVKEALSSLYLSEDSSECSTPVNQTHRTDVSVSSLPSESSHAWSTTTGTLTGRSSVYSWGNDNEFDRKATASVQKMFEEIDNMLYEGKHFDGGEALMSECEEWCGRFPHLRIRGAQILPSNDTGTELVALDEDDPRVYDYRPKTTVVDMESEDLAGYMQDFQGLAVLGNSVEAIFGGDEFAPTEYKEEVFAEDGCVEEYFAFDSSGSSEDFKKKALSKSRHHMGYPPVTPNAVATDTILSQIFDQLWGEIILWLRNLLTLYSQNVLRGSLSEKQPFIPELIKESESMDSRPASRDPFARTYQVRLRSGIKSSDVNGLNDLITIRSLPLKQRTTVYESREGTPVCQTRPESSSAIMTRSSLGRLLSWRNSDQHINSRMSSAKTLRRNPSLRLQPIDRSKTPALQENDGIGEGVRGTKLVTGSERLPSPNTTSTSPQLWGARNGTLPPIDKSEFLDTRPRGSAKTKVHFNLRAASAATDDSRKSLKDKGAALIDSRPNTTHSFRPPETSPTRRHSTPMGGVSGPGGQLRPAGSFGYSGQSMVTGITGVSMPISNYHPSTEHGIQGHQQLYYHVEDSALDEETDDFDDTIQWSQYQPPSTSNTRRGRYYSSIR